MQLRFPHYTLKNFISLYHTSLTRNFFYFTNKNEWLWKLDRTRRFRAVPCCITVLWSYETTVTRRGSFCYQFHQKGPKPPFCGSNFKSYHSNIFSFKIMEKSNSLMKRLCPDLSIYLLKLIYFHTRRALRTHKSIDAALKNKNIKKMLNFSLDWIRRWK